MNIKICMKRRIEKPERDISTYKKTMKKKYKNLK